MKFAKFIRTITIAPIIAIGLILGLYYQGDNLISYDELMFSLFFLVIAPILSYPFSRLLKNHDRKQQRNVAIIFSVVSYLVGFIATLFLQYDKTIKIIFFTYTLSSILIGLFSFVIKVKASGHICGVAGPIASFIYFLGWPYLWLVVVLILVGWSSLKLNRHSFKELILGFIIPIVSLIFSLLMF